MALKALARVLHDDEAPTFYQEKASVIIEEQARKSFGFDTETNLEKNAGTHTSGTVETGLRSAGLSRANSDQVLLAKQIATPRDLLRQAAS